MEQFSNEKQTFVHLPKWDLKTGLTSLNTEISQDCIEKKMTYCSSSWRFLSSSASLSAFSLACRRFSASFALYSSAVMSAADFSAAGFSGTGFSTAGFSAAGFSTAGFSSNFSTAGFSAGVGWVCGVVLPPSSSAPGAGDRTRTGVRDGVREEGVEGVAPPLGLAEAAAGPAGVEGVAGCCPFAGASLVLFSRSDGFCRQAKVSDKVSTSAHMISLPNWQKKKQWNTHETHTLVHSEVIYNKTLNTSTRVTNENRWYAMLDRSWFKSLLFPPFSLFSGQMIIMQCWTHHDSVYYTFLLPPYFYFHFLNYKHIWWWSLNYKYVTGFVIYHCII